MHHKCSLSFIIIREPLIVSQTLPLITCFYCPEALSISQTLPFVFILYCPRDTSASQTLPLPLKLVGERFLREADLAQDHSGDETNQRQQDHPVHGKTTLCVRNLPSNFKLHVATEFWSSEIWNYDFFRIPYRTSQRRISRYAFVNFKTTEDSMAFFDAWHEHTLEGSDIPLAISTASVQGSKANLALLRQTQLQGGHAVKMPSCTLVRL